MTKVVTSPGAICLSTVGKVILLKEDRLDKLCLTIAKKLWIIQRRRADCAPTIPFLCTSTKIPVIEDWKKLKRLLCFLIQMVDDDWIIGADNLNEIQTFIDSAHVVHEDMK